MKGRKEFVDAEGVALFPEDSFADSVVAIPVESVLRRLAAEALFDWADEGLGASVANPLVAAVELAAFVL